MSNTAIEPDAAGVDHPSDAMHPGDLPVRHAGDAHPGGRPAPAGGDDRSEAPPEEFLAWMDEDGDDGAGVQ